MFVFVDSMEEMFTNSIDIISLCVPAAISIIGFIITIFTMKKNFQNELAKQKANIQLDKMAVMPYEILALMQEMIDTGKKKATPPEQQKLVERMNWIFSSIYAYGSSTAIMILASMQSENYKNAAIPESADKYRVMAFYVLLTAQIRFDITGEVVSPEAWFKMRITDFQVNRSQIKEANNRLVEELKLNKHFLIQ